MTESALPEPLEALPIPEDAIWVDPARLAALLASASPELAVQTNGFERGEPAEASEAASRESGPQPSADRGGEAAGRYARLLVIAALQQELAQRHLALPFGPELAFADPDRLLQLNHVALQVVCGGWLEDPFAIPVAPWRQQATAPQLLVAARVGAESGLVRLAAVLTAQEWLQVALQADVATGESLPVGAAVTVRPRAPANATTSPGVGFRVGFIPDSTGDFTADFAGDFAGGFRADLGGGLQDEPAAIEPALLLPLEQLRGDLERLLVLVQLCAPEVAQAPDAALLPRLSLPGSVLQRAGLPIEPSRPGEAVVRVRDWLQEQLDPALEALGALIQPRLQPGFRESAAMETVLEIGAENATAGAGAEEALAVLAIPLGLDPEGQLCSGEAAKGCLERFRLLLIPTGSPRPELERALPLLAAPQAPSAAPRLEGLLLRLEPELPGDLLPDGLTLEAEQGSIRQSLVSAASSRLTLRFPASEALIQARLTSPDSAPLVLPALQLPR